MKPEEADEILEEMHRAYTDERRAHSAQDMALARLEDPQVIGGHTKCVVAAAQRRARVVARVGGGWGGGGGSKGVTG